MIAQKRLRYGIIGAGAIAQSYVAALQRSPWAELTAVADLREPAGAAVARAAKCRAYQDYRDMLRQSPLDAVVVCTPPVSHPEICTWFLEQGIHVLCEKPLAVNTQDAENMVNAASRSGNVFTMASKFRFVEDVVKAKSLVETGLLGDILQIENVFTSYVDMSRRWNSDAGVSGGGVLIDNGTHSVDLMRYLLGPLVEIQAFESARPQRLEVEDSVQFLARASSGVVGRAELSWSYSKAVPYFLSIYGSQGSFFVGWHDSGFRRANAEQWIPFGTGYNKEQAFSDQITDFSNAIHGLDELTLCVDDALASVIAVEAAYQSMNSDLWVPIEARPLATVANI